jgi:hypothetical protein
MTGRRLYDHYCDASYSEDDTVWSALQERWVKPEKLAWTYLKSSERRMWNALARRVTPKRGSR